MAYAFGAGTLFATPLTDAFGSTVANPTPVQFGTLQEVSLDIQGDIKELYGQLQFPVAVGRGKVKVSGKAKAAGLNGFMLNSIFFGQTLANGIYAAAYDTVGAAIPATPFQITPTVPSSGTWAADLGVIDGLTGRTMVRVPSAPAAGQYTVAAGLYTFAAADTLKTVFISYQYTATSTIAKKQTVANVPMGYAPTFRCDLYEAYNGKILTVTLNACVSTKLGFASKLDDFWVQEFDFSAFSDSSNNIMTWGLAE